MQQMNDLARMIAEEHRTTAQMDALVMHAHSRTGLLRRFLDRIAEGIDPTGNTRRKPR